MNDIVRIKQVLLDVGVEFEEMLLFEKLENAPEGVHSFITIQDSFLLFSIDGMFIGTWNGNTRTFYPKIL